MVCRSFYTNIAIVQATKHQCVLGSFLLSDMLVCRYHPIKQLFQLNSHELGTVLLNKVTAAGSSHNTTTSIGIGQTQ